MLKLNDTRGPAGDPYLSVVVTSRNDNHGGDLLLRMQTFVDALAELSDRVSLPVELLMVEWNPPIDRPRLTDALRWPDSEYCSFRIVEVPPDLHRRRYTVCGQHLPLFQMIAKNVGIRRARGKFILATNVDLIFSEDLMRWLASRPLLEGVSYRVDRYDVPLDVMQQSGVDAQLAYCERNILRINSRYGTFDGDVFAASRKHRWSNLEAFLAKNHELACFRQRAKEYWRRSKSSFRRAASQLSPAALIDGIRYAVKTGFRLARVPWRRLTSMFSRQKADDRRLHSNACGDFTLLARENWDRLRGYAEFEMYSWHLDSLFIYAAQAAGIRQEVLPHPIYHIEHSGGWTPENSQLLFRRLAVKGIPCLTDNELQQYRADLDRRKGADPSNGDDWGLASDCLPDYRAGRHCTATARSA